MLAQNGVLAAKDLGTLGSRCFLRILKDLWLFWLEAITIQLQAIDIQAIAFQLEAIAMRLDAIAIQAIAIQLEAIGMRLEAIGIQAGQNASTTQKETEKQEQVSPKPNTM